MQKLFSPVLKVASFLLFLGSPGSLGWAGDCGKGIESSVDQAKAVKFEISAGYDSKYIYRGINYANDLSWTQAAFDFALNETFNLWVGGWLATDASGNYSEYDLIAELGMTFENLYLGLGVTSYTYPATGDPDEFELYLNSVYTIGKTPFSLLSEMYYSPDLDSTFWNGGIKWESKLTDCVSIEASAMVGYNKHYFIENSDWNNASFRLALPVSPGGKLTIEPYAAVSIPLAALDDQGLPTETYGGVSAKFVF